MASNGHRPDRAEALETIRRLMARIDRRYEAGALAGIDELEHELEARLERLESFLEAVAEDFDPNEDLEPEPGEGLSIDEQLIAAWARHRRYPESPDQLAAHVRAVLWREQWWGPMHPSGLRPADDRELIELCRYVYEDEARRRRRRRRQSASRWGVPLLAVTGGRELRGR